MSRNHLTARLAHAMSELLELVHSAHFDREEHIFRVEVAGTRITLESTDGHEKPSLPPPAAARVYDTTAETVPESRPGLRKCAPVIRIHDRRKAGGSAA